jgi:hypothetical protein
MQGLIKVVHIVWHKHYVRHIYQTFHKKHEGKILKNDLWPIARPTNIPSWQKNMEKLHVK